MDGRVRIIREQFRVSFYNKLLAMGAQKYHAFIFQPSHLFPVFLHEGLKGFPEPEIIQSGTAAPLLIETRNRTPYLFKQTQGRPTDLSLSLGMKTFRKNDRISLFTPDSFGKPEIMFLSIVTPLPDFFTDLAGKPFRNESPLYRFVP